MQQMIERSLQPHETRDLQKMICEHLWSVPTPGWLLSYSKYYCMSEAGECDCALKNPLVKRFFSK